MILNAADIVDLQFFLMESVKRYAPPSASLVSEPGDVLAAAAGLDYALLVASERREQPVAPEDAAVVSACEAITRGASCALRVAHEMLSAPGDAFAEFEARFLRPGVADTIRSLRRAGAVDERTIAFAALTFENDLAERRASR